MRDAFERKLARRDDTIRVLQAQCDALTIELDEVRSSAERTQRTLEDALLERSIELAELRARQRTSEEKLFAMQHATAAE